MSNNNSKSPDVKFIAEHVAKRFGKRNHLDSDKIGYLADILNKFGVSYERRGNFTTAYLTTEKGVVVAGVAKRNPIDPDMPLRGQALALSRAFYSAAEKVLLNSNK